MPLITIIKITKKKNENKNIYKLKMNLYDYCFPDFSYEIGTSCICMWAQTMY